MEDDAVGRKVGENLRQGWGGVVHRRFYGR
jgi:hypothetical protein